MIENGAVYTLAIGIIVKTGYDIGKDVLSRRRNGNGKPRNGNGKLQRVVDCPLESSGAISDIRQMRENDKKFDKILEVLAEWKLETIKGLGEIKTEIAKRYR